MAWVIRGFDGVAQVFEVRITDVEVSDAEISAILQRLAARTLSYDEIIAASFPHGGARAAGPLDITLDDTDHGRRLSTVGNPYFVAETGKEPTEA